MYGERKLLSHYLESISLMEIVKQTTLDLLDQQSPALSSTNDIPVIETKPDSTPAPAEPEKKEVPAPEVKEAAPEKEKKAEESAPSDKPEDPTASDEPKKAKGVQKRIDELVRRENDERRRAEAAEARLDRALAALEKGVSKDAKQTIDEKDPEPQKPVKGDNPEAYDQALEEYIGARSSWTARREVAASLAEAEKKRVDEDFALQVKHTQESYRARVEKAKEKYADYTEVAESPDVQVSIAMASAIAHSEDGPEVAYFLGKNPTEAERISKLRPELQLLELGKISAKLSTPETPKPVSKAPQPGKPIKASSEVTKSPEEESMEEYASRRRKELSDRRPGVRH